MLALLVHVEFVCVECRDPGTAGTSRRIRPANQRLNLRGGGNVISCWADRGKGAAVEVLVEEEDEDVVDGGAGPVKIKLVLHYIGGDDMGGYVSARISPLSPAQFSTPWWLDAPHTTTRHGGANAGCSRLGADPAARYSRTSSTIHKHNCIAPADAPSARRFPP